jgi:hypothetical protein
MKTWSTADKDYDDDAKGSYHPCPETGAMHTCMHLQHHGDFQAMLPDTRQELAQRSLVI